MARTILLCPTIPGRLPALTPAREPPPPPGSATSVTGSGCGGGGGHDGQAGRGILDAEADAVVVDEVGGGLPGGPQAGHYIPQGDQALREVVAGRRRDDRAGVFQGRRHVI